MAEVKARQGWQAHRLAAWLILEERARRHHSGSEFIRAADPCNPWLHGIVPAYSAALVLWPREMPAACSPEIFSSTSGHLDILRDPNASGPQTGLRRLIFRGTPTFGSWR